MDKRCDSSDNNKDGDNSSDDSSGTDSTPLCNSRHIWVYRLPLRMTKAGQGYKEKILLRFITIVVTVLAEKERERERDETREREREREREPS